MSFFSTFFTLSHIIFLFVCLSLELMITQQTTQFTSLQSEVGSWVNEL